MQYIKVAAGVKRYATRTRVRSENFVAGMKRAFKAIVAPMFAYALCVGTSPVCAESANVYLPQPGSPGDHFGAIAFSTRNGAIGYSYDFSSVIDAEQSAIHRCGDDCTVVLAFANACGALAIGAGRGFGTGWARNRQQAERIALNYCNSSTTGCDIIQWACTTR